MWVVEVPKFESAKAQIKEENMKSIKKVAALVMAAVISVTAFAGCGGEDRSASSDTLNFGCFNYSDSLDPSVMVNAAWATSRYGIGECLFRFDDEMNAQPLLCDEYEVDDTNTIWQFHIRDGIKFSNGNEVNASSVVASIERMYEEEANGDGSSTPSVYMEYESITADDESNTVTIITTQPYADLCAVLAHPFFVILDTAAGTDYNENPIGTGPYAIDSYEVGTSIAMVANEYYWNSEVPYENLNIIFIGDSTTKAMAIENGDVDLVENITTPSDLDRLRNDSSYHVSEATGVRCAFSYMNQNGVLANDTLRQAILMALDDDTMCETTVGGMYTAGYSVLPSTLDYGYENLTDATPYDVEGAKKLLDDAGIVDSDGDGYRELNGETIDLNYLTYDGRNLADFTEAVVSYLKEIGIKATIHTTDADTEWNMLVAGEYDLLANNWLTVPVGDPYAYMDNWYSKSSANYCGYANEEYDAIYEQLKTETDENTRREMFQQLQQILIDDSAVLVHGYYHSTMISNENVIGAEIPTADYYWITTDIKPAS